jgi:spore maturation protein CgeB
MQFKIHRTPKDYRRFTPDGLELLLSRFRILDCAPVGGSRDLVEDGVSGFYAMASAEWEEKLSLLIESPQLREQMGREGRKRVLENYTHQTCAPRLLSTLNQVAEVGRKIHHAV